MVHTEHTFYQAETDSYISARELTEHSKEHLQASPQQRYMTKINPQGDIQIGTRRIVLEGISSNDVGKIAIIDLLRSTRNIVRISIETES